MTSYSSSQQKLPILPLPCISAQGAKVFALTADQRFLSHETADFLRTHFPVRLQSYHLGRSVTLSEDQLLNKFLHTDGVSGNRVMILYGAAGSGKSELLRWLQTQIHQKDQIRAKVMVRISRTDLDIFHIFQRFQHFVSTPVFQDATQQRWQECRRKPRTLAKILVLTALEQLLSSDDHINALYYQLVDVVQANFERCFAAMSNPGEEIGQFIELFSREDLDQMLRESVIPIPLEYEMLRHTMLKVFRDQLLEGLNFSDLLKRVSLHVQEMYGQRPILLIDDLVQSINLFATDVLDYFMTLEEGNWDVLIGITPSSLDTTLRGKELLDRIQYLDTIDDRVQKLWLSDEYGLSSSFLNEENCTEYARLYLREYKRFNQAQCNISCPSFQHCRHLDPDKLEDVLTPFNKNILRRLFKSLPAGKGKVRYFTLYLGEILERMSSGEDLLAVLPDYIKPEHVVYHTNQRIAQIYEFYGPLVGEQSEYSHTEDLSAIYTFFGVLEEDQKNAPVVTSLLKRRDIELNHVHQLQDPEIDPGKEAIKAWLQGVEVNKQLLRNVRRGVARAVKDGYAIDCMTRLNTAKSNHVLRWTRSRFETLPPIQLESVDDFAGLSLHREIGPLAYLFHDFADIAGHAEQEIRGMLVSNESFPYIMFQAIEYRKTTRKQLEDQINMSVEHLAFSLFLFARSLGHRVVVLPPQVESCIEIEFAISPHYPESLERERPHLTSYQVNVIRRFFDDCFKLRENIYDGFLLSRLTGEVGVEQAFNILASIDVVCIDSDFRLNERPLGDFLLEIQQIIIALTQLKSYPGIKTLLLSLYRAGLEQDEASQKFVAMLRLPGDINELVDLFLEKCSLYQMHIILTIASSIDDMQFERSQLQLQKALKAIEGSYVGVDQNTSELPPLRKSFTHNEISILTTFAHQDFRMPIDQLSQAFLTKIAQYFPDVYRQLEVRLQRG